MSSLINDFYSLWLDFKFARHEAGEKEVPLTGKEKVLMLKIVHLIIYIFYYFRKFSLNL